MKVKVEQMSTTREYLTEMAFGILIFLLAPPPETASASVASRRTQIRHIPENIIYLTRQVQITT